MLRLRSCVVSQLLSPPSPVSHLRRLLSASAPPVSPNPPISPNPEFAVKDYLVNTRGLTGAQAQRASRKLSRVRSPSNIDAVFAFLACIGLSRADAASVVARDPKFLGRGVHRTLAANFVELTGHGLSRREIARLVFLAPDRFLSRSIVSDLHYYQPLLGSSVNLLRVLERGAYLVGTGPEKVVNPNVVFLRECRLGARDIAKICLPVPRMLTAQPERVRAMVACAERIGVPPGSRMFSQALEVVKFLNEEKITAKVEYLKKTFRWSDAEVSRAVSKALYVLMMSEDSLQVKSDFLISEVGLEPAYIARRPAILCYRMKRWLRPRYHVVKFLKAKGLLDQNRDFYNVVCLSKKIRLRRLAIAYGATKFHSA
ncbi:unnamed protein product [Alopecurus aequalis]